MLAYITRILLRWGGITLAFVTLVATCPTLWLKLAYGGKYASDGYVLRLYAILYLMIFIAGPLRAGLQALEYTQPIFWAYSFLTVVSVVMAGPFTRELGLTGVLLGMIGIQIVFQGIIGIALFKRVRRLDRDLRMQRSLSLVGEVPLG
jgi:O-antigen/teichoic acid export membrane protein